jgi:hypothetical protein
MHSDLEPLLSTSREMRDLAYRSYYKYGIILKPVYNWACFRVVKIPCAEAARHIRRIELHLDIPNVLRSGKIWRHRTEELLHLLRPEDADSSSARKSAWQRKLPSVDTLKVRLTMERSNRDYGLCLQGEKGWKEMFRHVVVDIAARYVEVEVSGFKCDKVEYDTVVV